MYIESSEPFYSDSYNTWSVYMLNGGDPILYEDFLKIGYPHTNKTPSMMYRKMMCGSYA